jgi:hypothetical protein
MAVRLADLVGLNLLAGHVFLLVFQFACGPGAKPVPTMLAAR